MSAPPVLTHHRQQLQSIIDAALAAAAPGPALAAAVRTVDSSELHAAGVLALGKAAGPMYAAFAELPDIAPASALVIHPRGAAALPPHPNLTILESDHPLPTARSLAAGEAALNLAEQCRGEDRPLVVLLSGGASSLACVPEPGLTIDDLAACSQALMRAGATIDELNIVRSLCDRIKGGGLAAAAATSPVYTFILSDVIGDSLSAIGSSPTAKPEATGEDALAILKRFKLDKKCKPIAAHLRLLAGGKSKTRVPEVDWSNVHNTIIANNSAAIRGGAGRAIELGFIVGETRSDVTGEARAAAFEFVGAIRRARARASGAPVAVFWGGETTVTVRGKGTGGRNLEAALAAAIAIDNDQSLIIATFATDGIDGPTGAAGAIVNGHTASDARRAGIDPEDALAANDSYTFFSRQSEGAALIKRGPTGTNVNDVWIGLAY